MSQENKTAEQIFAEKLSSKRQEIEVDLEAYRVRKHEVEAEENLNAQKSPMALVFELIGCQFWQYDMNTANEKNIPNGQFTQHPCIRNKAHPDQDCRDCSYVQYGRYGSHLPMYEKRYLNHGVVIPISEEEMDELGHKVNEMGLKPLQRHQSKIHALENALDNIKINEEHAKRIAAEAQQRGQMAPQG